VDTALSSLQSVSNPALNYVALVLALGAMVVFLFVKPTLTKVTGADGVSSFTLSKNQCVCVCVPPPVQIGGKSASSESANGGSAGAGGGYDLGDEYESGLRAVDEGLMVRPLRCLDTGC
jgi:hypothetical protein